MKRDIERWRETEKDEKETEKDGTRHRKTERDRDK